MLTSLDRLEDIVERQVNEGRQTLFPADNVIAQCQIFVKINHSTINGERHDKGVKFTKVHLESRLGFAR